jgi:hypothetical protein
MAAKKKQRSKPKSKTNGAVKHKKGPRQLPIPGTEDREITSLQDAALDYAELRDARIAASAAEVQAKTTLLDLMHSYKRTTYKHDNVFIEIVPEGEKLKVKILKEGEEAPEPKASKQTEFEPAEFSEPEPPESPDAA